MNQKFSLFHSQTNLILLYQLLAFFGSERLKPDAHVPNMYVRYGKIRCENEWLELLFLK